MYALLAATLLAGLATTVLGNLLGHPYDYRLGVAPYFRPSRRGWEPVRRPGS